MVNHAPRILSGRYEVGELIGRGGMAEVHIGHDSRLGRTVAIKILRSDLARDPSFQARFRREAQAAASLNHPAIVAVYDTGEDTVTEVTGAVSHVPFIVMEYVEGHTVRDILRDGSAVPIEEALEITAGVLSALEYSHHAGIVHRDIKPANVMLTPTGAVKVMDFGIARALADSAATMTQTQAVIGTAQYLSPEQARGDQVDTRSDLYSTGCLLYELLTGRPPFTGDSPVAVAYQHVREIPKAPSTVAPDIPAILDSITLRALEKDREDRYSTAAEFRAAIEAAARGEAVDPTLLAAPLPVPVGVPATQVMAQQAPAPQEVAPSWQQQAPEEDLLPDTQDEEESKKKWVWILLTVGLLAALVIAAFLLLNNKDRPIMVTMPNLNGMNVEQAKEELVQEGFTAEPVINTKTSVDIPKDIFIESKPGRGEVVDASLPVELWFSVGPEAVIMPTLADMDLAEAKAALEKEGLKVGMVQSENSDKIKKDRVTRTVPAAGDEIPEGTVVELWLSDGFMKVPDVASLGVEGAKAELSRLDFEVVEDEEETSEVEAGTLMRQSPEGGELVEQGSTIKLVIAKAPPAVLLPPLAGLTRNEAFSVLNDLLAGLTLKYNQEFSDTVPAGEIISTSPEAGTEIKSGDTINIYISKGPQTTPDPSDSPTDSGTDGTD